MRELHGDDSELELKCVPSHTDEDSVVQGHISLVDLIGNHLADTLADRMADEL